MQENRMSETDIVVHELSEEPTRYWESWVQTASQFSLEIENSPYERCSDKVKIFENWYV